MNSTPTPTLPGGPPRRRVAVFSALVLALLVFVLIALLGTLVNRYYDREAREQRVVRARAAAAPYANAITIALARRISVLQGLAATVRLHRSDRDFAKQFADFTRELSATSRDIRTMQLVEDGIVVMTHPLAGNEVIVGFDLRNHANKETWSDYQRAVASGSVVLSGPMQLVQGGLGLVARQAVRDPAGRPIGVVAVVIDIPPLLQEAGFFDSPGLAMGLLDHRGQLIAGVPGLAGPGVQSLPVILPDRRWELRAVLTVNRSSIIDTQRTALRVAALVLALLLAVITFMAASRHALLRRMVYDATSSLRQANTDLEEQIRQRESVEHQLQIAQRLEGLGRLAGGVAHDFNNLLTGILGFVSMLQETYPPGHESRDDLDQIERAARRATDLTRQLLTFARQQPVEARPINLNALIDESAVLLEHLAGRNVEFELDLHPVDCSVEIDPTQLEQVLSNLVMNARDAMPEGGTLTISTSLEESAGASDGRQFVSLVVADTGSGMDEEIIAHVFEPFFTTKDAGKGTGLGLSICYGIIRAAGGYVTVASSTGDGTAFDIRLPCSGAVPQRPREDALAATWSARGRVLIADDEVPVREFVRRALERRGLTVREVGDGNEAIQLAPSAADFTALITDIRMPGADGVAVATAMLDANPELRILVMSGHALRQDVESFLQRPHVHFLPKPFTAGRFDEALRTLLDGLWHHSAGAV